jgi:hypothetical protein
MLGDWLDAMNLMSSHFVIAGLDPAIHPFQKMDARVKPAHDGGGTGPRHA